MAANFLTITDQDKPLTATGVKNRMIAKLLEQGSSGEPISSHWQGINRVAQSLLGGYQLKEADKEEKANQALQAQTLASLLGAPSAAPAAPAAPPMSPPQSPQGPMTPRPIARPPASVPPSNDSAMGIPQGQADRVNGVPSQPAAPPITWGDGQVGQPNQLPPPQGLQATSSAAPPDMQAKIAAMLHPSQPPAVQQMGRQLAAKILAERMQGPKFSRLNDDALYDERTGRVQPIAGDFYRPITDPAERARYGIPAEDKRPYQLGPGGKLINPPAESRVTVDQRGEGAFSQNAGRLNADRFNDLVKGGFEAQGMVADLQALREIGGRITTGKNAQITAALGPYAEMLGVKIDGLDDMQAYQSIISRLAPRMRVAGSGATSDFEMRQFLAALPTLGNNPQGNEIITNTLDALQQHRMAAADIGSRALAGELSPREAERMIRELPDPLQHWKKTRGQSPVANPTRRPIEGRTGNGLNWRVED